MPTMAVDLPVQDRAVTVVGSSTHAMATTAALIAAGAVVTAVSLDPAPHLQDQAARGLLTLRRSTFTSADIGSAELIFAYTGDPERDAAIADEATTRGVFCVRTHPHAGSAHSAPAHNPTPGRVILVGGGPGDPGLLTVAGRDAITLADVIVTDRLAPVSALAELAPHAEIVDVSKIPGGRRTEQCTINDLLVTHAQAGKTVVRLKGGDGFVFGRGGEEIDHCVTAGVSVDVIPGVSSSIAAPATALIPVTHRGLTQGFTVVSGHVPPGHPESTVNYRALAQANTTIVLMMAVANLEAIAASLLDAGMAAETPAAVIADGTLSSQRVLRAPLRSIASLARRADIGPPATTVIGAVAGFLPGRTALPELSVTAGSPQHIPVGVLVSRQDEQ